MKYKKDCCNKENKKQYKLLKMNYNKKNFKEEKEIIR